MFNPPRRKVSIVGADFSPAVVRVSCESTRESVQNPSQASLIIVNLLHIMY